MERRTVPETIILHGCRVHHAAMQYLKTCSLRDWNRRQEMITDRDSD
jgi:hypothetical protein